MFPVVTCVKLVNPVKEYNQISNSVGYRCKEVGLVEDFKLSFCGRFKGIDPLDDAREHSLFIAKRVAIEECDFV